MLDKIKEFFTKLNISVTKYLTPINYIEYAIKALLILRVINLQKLLYTLVGLDLVFLILAGLKKSFLSPASVLISLLIHAISLTCLVRFKKKIARKKRMSNEKPQPKFRDVYLKDIPVPMLLQEFNKKKKGE